jgi:hypothetical protein
LAQKENQTLIPSKELLQLVIENPKPSYTFHPFPPAHQVEQPTSPSFYTSPQRKPNKSLINLIQATGLVTENPNPSIVTFIPPPSPPGPPTSHSFTLAQKEKNTKQARKSHPSNWTGH